MKPPTLQLLPGMRGALTCFPPRCGPLQDEPHGPLNPDQNFSWHVPDFAIYSNGTKPGTLQSDITYLRTGEGWLYLCADRDGHSRRVLGWAMDRVQDTSLVERALRMAHTLRGDVPDGLVFHADRGMQFTSEKLWEVCRNLGIAQSVGRTGVCFHNAMAESFWSTLKTEFHDRKRWPPAMLRVRLWLTGLKSSTTVDADTEALGMVSPIDFENHTSLTTSRKEIAT